MGTSILQIKTMRLPKRKTALFLTASICSLIALAFLFDSLFPLNLPNNNNLFAHVVVDKDNRPLRAFPDKNGVWRYEVNLGEVSPLYIEALLNYEDRRFWYHFGIDPIAILRASYSNIKNGKIVSGGSTISMQVARLLHPHSRSLSGKLYQILRTLQLEWQLSKKEILTLYCNIAPFGGTIEGVQAASFTYLNKPASELTRAEAALLAVLPQSPTRLRPDLHPQKAQIARNKVLDRLQGFDKWTQTEIEQARLEQVVAYRHQAPQHAPLLARRLLQQNTQNRRVIKTTIDGDLQRALEDYIRYYVEHQPDKTSAAALVIDNRDSAVLAYIGTADFGNRERFGHVDMVTAIRSPGSTLKPFLYAMAMDKGLIHSHTLMSDTPRSWNDYRPGNFSGGFSGPVSANEALQRSLNIPAVTLLDKFGPADFSARLQNAGIQLSMPNAHANLAIILGGVGTNLEDLVRGYSAFANRGKTQKLQFSPRHETPQKRYFFSPQAAWITQDSLSSVSRPGSVHGIAALAGKKKLAWKTGTSYGFRDSWAIGVDARYTIGVWVGRPDGTPNPGASGRSHAGPLLHTIADHLQDARQAITQPNGITQREICWPLGTLKNEQPKNFCHKSQLAWVMNNTIPPSWPDRLHPLALNPTTIQIDPKNQRRVHSGCNHNLKTETKTVALWPSELEPWIPQRYRRHNQLPPLARHCITGLGNETEIRINGLENGTRFAAPVNSNTAPTIKLQATGGEGDQHWFIDGRFHHRSTNLTSAQVTIARAGLYQIVVVDSAGNLDKVQIEIQ